MSPARKKVFNHANLPLIGFLCVVSLSSYTNAAVDISTTAYFRHRAEAWVGGEQVFTGAAMVEVARFSDDTYVIALQPDTGFAQTSLVGNTEMAMVLKVPPGRPPILLHHLGTSTPSDLNYQRSIASLFTYNHLDVPLSYSSKEGIHGLCEVTQQHMAATTLTTWHLDSCSKPFKESVRAFHHLPFLHLALDTSESSFTCEHEWHPQTKNLESGSCHENFRIAPRFSTADKVLNVSLVSSLEKVRAAPFLSPRVYNYLRSATEPTSLAWEETKPEPADATTLGGLMDEYCVAKQEMGPAFLERMGRLLQAVSSNPENLPLVSPSCNAPAMRMLALTAAMVAGPRALSVFYHILQELESEPWSESLLDAGPLNVMALQSLATANPHLPADFFLRPETRNIYTQLVEKLVKVQPPPVAAVAALLESLSSSAPHLLPELLAVSAPILSPAKACLEGHPQQAITTLKALAGLSVRPVDHISSLRSCFATEDVAVQVAAMESLSHVKCEVQGVTELLRLGLESSSDPEIRIAAYQSLLHCLPGDPSLLESFIKVLTAKDETFSNQVASYIWSHLRAVRDSEDPSLAFLQEAIITSKTLADLTDPVAYDPRSHSRHTHRTWYLDIHTAFTLRADLVWGRTSPAPRSLSLQLLLHRDETTHDVAQIQLRLRGLHKLLLKIPGVESLLDLLFKNGEELMKAAATLAASSATNDFTQQMVQNFLQQLLSRIPSEYLDSKAEVQLSLRFLGQLLFHDLVVDSSVPQNNQFQEFLQNNVLSKTVFLMPLVHNAITLPSSAGVPIDVTVNGVGGMFLLASHQYEEPARLFDIRASGGLSLTTQVTVASKRGLLSSLIGALDLPLTFIYEGKGSGGIRLRARLPLEPHHTLMLWEMRSRRIGTEGIFRLPLITQTSCLLEEDRVQICLQRGEGVDQHWLAPFTTSVHLTSPVGAGTITFDVDHQRAGHVDTTRFIFVEDLRDLESGRSPRTIDGSVVLEFGDVPAATFSLNTPGNSYYLRGYMGIKDGISHATEIEFVANQERWGAKLQVSTPQLAGQRVWGPALFITTPYGGKREALRAYLSLKESAHNTTADFSMRTDGLLAETLLPLKVAGKVTVTLTDKETVSSVRVDNLQFISPELFDIILGGVLDIDGNDKLGNLKISSQPDAFVNLEVSLGRDEENSPETASLPISSPTSWTRGSFKFEISHPKLSRPFGAAASLVLNSTMTEVEVTVSLGSDNGSFYFSLGNFGPGFTTIISVTYSPLEIVWRGRVEWLWEEGHSKSAFSVSWSPHPHHSFTIAHEFWQQVDPFLKKLNFMVDTLGQRIELRETISEGLSGGIKHLAEINIEPGPKISLDTVLVSRNDEEVISYGISNELKLDSWEDALRIMGMANCMGETSCGLVMNIAMGTVEWADLEIKYTEINENIINIDNMVFIKDLLHVNMTVDVDSGKGFAQAQVTGSVFPVSSHFEGEIRFNISKVDIIVVEVVARPMTGEEQPHMIYNGTVSIVQESRSLHTRQELWLLQDGIFQQHGMLLQGRLGPELLNEQHFIKMIITLPDDIYYSSSLYLDSEVKEVNCSASVSLAVDGGPDNKYLITGNFDLKHLNENDGSTFVEAAQPVDQDIPPEHQEDHTKDEPPVVSLSSLLRLNTPQTGDIKVTTKGTYIENDGKEILDLDVRLVTTTFPELGRLHMAYVVVPDLSYSVHGKVSSGRHSFSIVSYGITSPDSMKSSSSVKIKSPTSSWQEAEVILEMDLIGTFPELFQSSIEVKGTIQFFRTGNFRVSVQRTANLIGFGIVFTSPWNTIPGGNTYIEWNTGDVQGHVMWGSMKAVAKFELNKNSEGFKVTFNLDNPGADIFDIDLNLKISLVQVLRLLTWRLKVSFGRRPC
ncbi:uncharacterized protein LOC143025360 isoform X2 [Oratosquilla oratoria]|uniref:uncharacterized protein LOC143025360 isoform X2 n=1 Tax=Oratosquilla oratoria TaxID=337810 RepID=UPI003F765E67